MENTCKSCIPCLASTPSTNLEPLRMTKLPDQPWTHLSCDFCGPFPNGDYLLVVIDDYSRFPIVEIVRSTSAKATIPKLDRIFSEYGIPVELKTDNGPPFQGAEFKEFVKTPSFVFLPPELLISLLEDRCDADDSSLEDEHDLVIGIARWIHYNKFTDKGRREEVLNKIFLCLRKLNVSQKISIEQMK